MKKLLIVALIAGAATACGGNDNPNHMNNNADSINNVQPAPDTSGMNTDTSMNRDTTGVKNP
jgi:hypothetical protein